MELDFDPEKSAKNEAARGLSFDRVADLDWRSTVVWRDGRRDYGEEQFNLLGLLDQRVCSLTYCIRDGKLRVISFRKANGREVKKYEESIKQGKR